MFLQHHHIVNKYNSTLVTGWDGNKINAQCYGCHKWGDFAFNLPNNNNNYQRQEQGRGKIVTILFQVIVAFIINEYWDTIPCTWILIDTFSTVSVSNSTYMIGKISDCTDEEYLIVHTNGCSNTFKNISPLKLLPL